MWGTKCPTVRSGGTTSLRSALMPILMTSRASMEFFLPSPLVGEGGEIDRREIEPGEGSQSVDRTPHPARTFSAPPSPARGEGKSDRVLFLPKPLDEGHPALHLVNQRRFVDLDHHSLGIDAEILHQRLRDVAHHRDLLLVGTAGRHADGDLGHPTLLLFNVVHRRPLAFAGRCIL